MIKYLTFILLLTGCESVQPVSSTDVDQNGHVLEYNKTDIDDVKTSYNTVKNNQDLVKVNVSKGVDRAKRFESLFIKLIAQYDFGVFITNQDIKPFRDELNDISSIFNEEESKAFTMIGTQNKRALEIIKKEADKGLNNNAVDKAKDKKIKELQNAIDLKLAIFDAGAPMTAVLFANHWDEESKGVYASSDLQGGTFALDSEFEHDGKWLVKHIDEYIFHPYTYQYYMDTYPDNEAILARIPKNNEGEYDEAWLDKTPQMWVSDVLIGDNYTVIDI